jgi:hypothetical protein
MSVSVVVDEFDIFRTSISPDKTDTPLCVHADAVLASAVTRQPLQPIAWRNSEILYDVGGVNELELPQGRPLNRSIDSLDVALMPDAFGVLADEGPDHDAQDITLYVNNAIR